MRPAIDHIHRRDADPNVLAPGQVLRSKSSASLVDVPAGVQTPAFGSRVHSITNQRMFPPGDLHFGLDHTRHDAVLETEVERLGRHLGRANRAASLRGCRASRDRTWGDRWELAARLTATSARRPSRVVRVALLQPACGRGLIHVQRGLVGIRGGLDFGDGGLRYRRRCTLPVRAAMTVMWARWKSSSSE